MSNIIPPLISSSPPPLDLAMESDEEDEFRPPIEDDSYSCDDFVLPNELPDIDIPEMDINRNKKEDKDFHDKRKSEESSEYKSDVILPNIQDIVPNINRHNDDLKTDTKNSDIVDTEDIDLINKKVNGFIPKESEPITTPLIDESINYLHHSVEVKANKHNSDSDINSPTEIMLNIEINDKLISDKELSSSEPNFESCSDDSLKEHENNDSNANCKGHDKSIGDVDEIDDDFGDFADFNNISSCECNSLQITKECEKEYIKNLSGNAQSNGKTTDSEEVFTYSSFNVDFKSKFGKDYTESIKINDIETVLKDSLNLSSFTMDVHIDSEKSNTSNSTTDSDKTTEIDIVSQHLSEDSRGEADYDFAVSNVSFISKNEYEITSRIEEIETVALKSFESTYKDDADQPYSSTVIQNTAQSTILQSTFNDSDDEFGEFDSCTAALNSKEEHPEIAKDPPFTNLHIDRDNVHEKSKEILQMMFPVDSHLEIDFLQDQSEDNDIFSQIKNLTETNAITYQWNKSNSQQTLLKVLNIDIRNILYGPGWNSSMPIFAANLSSAPLEPQKTSLPTIITSASNDLSDDSSGVCDARFDWASSGLTNPLDTASQKDISLKESSLGEPRRSFDTESVNSLQFTEVTTENIDDKSVILTDQQGCDNFADFQQTVKTAKSEFVPPLTTSVTNAMFPLRETYINIEDNEIIQSIKMNSTNGVTHETVPTELQNEFQRSKARNNLRTDDDFTEFQASLPEIILMDSKQSTNRSIEYKLAIENPIDPELMITKQSSKMMQSASEILQPTILQTLKIGNTTINSAVNIEWPEPGITDYEIRKFEEYSYSKAEKRTLETLESAYASIESVKEKDLSNSCVVFTKQTPIDDEWSDFQDAAKELPLSIASLGKIAQNQALSQQRHIIAPSIAQTSILKQNIWPNTYQQNTNTIHSNFPSQIKVQQPQPISAKRGNLGKVEPQIRFDQTVLKPTSHVAPHTRQLNSANDDEWSDFVCHQPNANPSAPNFNHRQEDWTMRGPQFSSWTSTSVTPNIDPCTSRSTALHFNGFNSFGRSANILNAAAKSGGSVHGKNRASATILGIHSKKESVPSISALPDLDFATSANRFSSGRMQQQKK